MQVTNTIIPFYSSGANARPSGSFRAVRPVNQGDEGATHPAERQRASLPTEKIIEGEIIASRTGVNDFSIARSDGLGSDAGLLAEFLRTTVVLVNNPSTARTGAPADRAVSAYLSNATADGARVRQSSVIDIFA